MFLHSNSISPFAFNPENIDSREVTFEDNTTLTINFDMSVKETPECAAVAVIFDTPKHFDNIHLKLFQKGEPLNITVELKTMRNGILTKFREQNVASDGCIDFFNLKNDINEIVFCCWRSNNKGKKGTIKIKAQF